MLIFAFNFLGDALNNVFTPRARATRKHLGRGSLPSSEAKRRRNADLRLDFLGDALDNIFTPRAR